MYITKREARGCGYASARTHGLPSKGAAQAGMIAYRRVCSWEGWCAHPNCDRLSKGKNCPEHQEEQRQYNKQHQAYLTEEFWKVYPPVCSACGLEDSRIMELDHVNGDGAHRRKAFKEQCGPTGAYRRLKRKGFPPLKDDGLCVLCPNCHALKTKGFLVVGG